MGSLFERLSDTGGVQQDALALAREDRVWEAKDRFCSGNEVGRQQNYQTESRGVELRNGVWKSR